VCDGINPCTPLREPREFWGVEATTDWQIDPQWTVGALVSWNEGIRKTTTGDTRRIGSRDIPPLLVSGYVEYAPTSSWRNTLWVDYRHSRDPFGDSTTFGEGRVDSVTLLSYAAAFKLNRGELVFGIRNLLNEKYFSIPAEAGNVGATWVPEEGMRATLAYTVKW
jgi:iron complex outermembrane receptor protein